MDLGNAKAFKPNQIVKMKVSGFKKQRSVSQLGLLMACIKLVSDNTENPNWDTLNRAKLSLKASLNFVETSSCVVVENRVIIQYKSFSFKELPHMIACNLFDRAFPILGDVIGLTAEQLVQEAKKLMGGRCV